MTPEAINAAIAEWMGWKDVRYSDTWGGWQGYAPGKSKIFTTEIPRFYHDLNAVHEAEARIVDGADNELRSRWFINIQKNGYCAGTHATAAQRSTALVRTIGKWKE